MKLVKLELIATECQRCFTLGPECTAPAAAEKAARNKGWLEIDEKTYCLDCRRELEEDKAKKSKLKGGV